MSLVSLALEHSEDIIAIGALVGGLLFNRSRKATLDDLWETMEKLGKQALPRLLSDHRLTDDVWVLGQITEAIWAGLDRIGVKRSKTLEKLVSEAAEHVKAELADAVIKQLLGKYIDVSTKTAEQLKSAT